MCGRIYGDFGIDDVRAALPFSVQTRLPDDFTYRQFNGAPTCDIVALTRGRVLEIVNWGVSVNDRQLINAKVESCHEKPTFLRMERCLAFISGWFEWDSAKRPFLVVGKGNVLTVAALKNQTSIVIATMPSDSKLNQIHNRMPVLLFNSEAILKWLDSANNFDFFDHFLRKSVNDNIDRYDFWEVSKRVGNVKFNDPKCIERTKETKLDDFFVNRRRESIETSDIDYEDDFRERTSQVKEVPWKRLSDVPFDSNLNNYLLNVSDYFSTRINSLRHN